MRTQKRNFTKRYLDTFKPLHPKEPGYGSYIWDAGLEHFGAKRHGALDFYVGLRDPRTKAWVERRTGQYDGTAESIQRAREEARRVINAVLGNMPLPATHVLDVAGGIDLYVDTLSGLDTRKEIEQKLHAEVIPVLGRIPLSEVRHEDIVTLLGNIASRTRRNRKGSKIASGGPHAARKTHAYLNPFFTWAAHERIGGLTVNPMAAISMRLITNKVGAFNLRRDHLISDLDIRTIWQAAVDYPFGSVVRLLAMTGARLNEIARLRRDEILGDAIVLQPKRTKTEELKSIPITFHMAGLIDALPDYGPGTFVFSTDGGKTAIAGFSKFKAQLDARAAVVEPWQIHDLRRLARTGLSRVGVDTLIAELVIGHKRRGIEPVYDRFTFEARKRAALEAWQSKLFELVEPPPALLSVAS